MDIRRTWPMLFLIVTVLLLCRQPFALIHPSLYAEDGCIFFKQQYEMGFSPSLVTRYAGYPHFAPRIIAGLCSYVPLEYVPIAYATVSLLIAAAALTFFFAPGFRPIVDNDLLRACIVIGFVLMPNAEALMKLAYINWYMLFFTSLLMIYSLPKRCLGRCGLFLLAAIAVWSNPASVICLPLMLYRAWKSEDRGKRLWWIALILLVLSFPFAVEKQPSQMAMLLHERSWQVVLVRSLGYRVFCFFLLGPMLTYPMPWEGWRVVTPFSLALAALCSVVVARTYFKTRRPGLGQPALLLLAYMILALPAMFVLRKEWQRFFLTWTIECWQGSDRYFFCSTLLMCVLAGIVYERMFRPWMIQSPQRCQLSLLVLLAWLTLQGLGFRMDAWHTKESWSLFTRQIHEAEARVRQTGKYEVVHVSSNPEGFDFDLMITQTAANRNHPGN